MVAQIPDPGLHLTRSYGAYSNRLRKTWAHLRMGPDVRDGAPVSRCGVGASKSAADDAPDSPFVNKQKAAWMRLLWRLLEVDPSACPSRSRNARGRGDQGLSRVLVRPSPRMLV